MYHGEHVLIFSWHHKAVDVLGLQVSLVTIRVVKRKEKTGRPQRARAAANLLWPHCAAVRIEGEMRRRCEQKLLLHLKLRTASLLRAAQKRNVQYRSCMGWNCDPAVRGKQILIYLRSFSFLFSFFSFAPLQFRFHRLRVSAPAVSGDDLWISFGFECKKKRKRKRRREVVWNPKKPQSLSEGAFYAQLLSVQWTMPLTPGQYGG